MTVVFLPVERFWPLHPDQLTFRPQWRMDLFYFVATHLPAQLMTLLMIIPATYASKWLAIPWLGTHRREPAVSDRAAARDSGRRSLAVRHAPGLPPRSVAVALSRDPSLHRDDGLGGRIPVALCRYPAHARTDPRPDDDRPVSRRPCWPGISSSSRSTPRSATPISGRGRSGWSGTS